MQDRQRFTVTPGVRLRVTPTGVRGAHVSIDGEPVRAVAERLLVGGSTPAELVRSLPGVEPMAVLGAVAELRAAGMIASAGTRPTAEPRVRMHGAAPIVTAAFVGAGLRVVDGDADLDVVVGDVDEDALDAHNAAALATGRIWCLVRADGEVAWAGPVFVPGRTGCWTCAAHRLAATQPVRGAGASVAPAAEAMASALAATVVRAFLDGDGAAATPGVLWTFDMRTMTTGRHELVRRPQCPNCGAVERRSDVHSEIRLAAADRPHPSATAARLERFVSPILGAVPSLRRLPVGDGLHVWQAGGNPAVAADGAVRRTLRLQASGKGRTDDEARAGALAEAIERHQGIFTGTEPRRTSRMRDLPGAIDPNAVQLFSDRQFATRDAQEARHRDRVPEPFDPDTPIEWTSVWSLTHAAPRWLPSSICWYGYRGAPTGGWVADSNGCAAGNTLAEAVLHGLLELVERDAVAIWWYNRLRRPAVDLDAIDDPWLTAARHRFAALGRPVHVLDVTSDLGVPTAVAVSGPKAVVLGFGAHPDPVVAVRRAVGEAAQLLAVIPGGPLGTRSAPDPVTRRRLAEATFADQQYLCPDPSLLATRPERGGGAVDVLAELADLRARVGRAGCEVLVLDQTRPEIGFPTVRVIAPGLRHFWTRFAPGRLYDVPVREGWRRAAAAEADLNPFTMPM